MKNNYLLSALLLLIVLSAPSFKLTESENSYWDLYHKRLSDFQNHEKKVLDIAKTTNLNNTTQKNNLIEVIAKVRHDLKSLDFWFRYFEPISYKKINGPLPVEWETEVYEKFEKPYRREGAGYSLALQYLNDSPTSIDSLVHLLEHAVNASENFAQDSITAQLMSPEHFYYCNRLFLLNLAAIYTTGFECPNTEQVIPELKQMLVNTTQIYYAFNKAFPTKSLSTAYQQQFDALGTFVLEQPNDFEQFDHYSFIREYINPLFKINQNLIATYQLHSRSLTDYSLNDKAGSIFSKTLYRAQNTKGIYSRIYDQKILNEIKELGKTLFFDPILSGNNQRSCASCHQPNEGLTDTLNATSLQFNNKDYLPRNTPSLLNASFNHLLMVDGMHLTLQDQARAVISNSLEMQCNSTDLLQKILSCKTYKNNFTKLLPYTPLEPKLSVEHIYSALTYYYGDFSTYEAPFDHYMNKKQDAPTDVKLGFNLFMSKAQCATCHFAPIFNGVKPPYVGSEFEVLGVPADTNYKLISTDLGRQGIFAAPETFNAFRTGTIRNSSRTKPYMHNGVFKTLDALINFYDAGGGQGHGLTVDNQTLGTDSLHLTESEKKNLLAFIRSLDEEIPDITSPTSLPLSKNKSLNTRKISGTY